MKGPGDVEQWRRPESNNEEMAGLMVATSPEVLVDDRAKINHPSSVHETAATRPLVESVEMETMIA